MTLGCGRTCGTKNKYKKYLRRQASARRKKMGRITVGRTPQTPQDNLTLATNILQRSGLDETQINRLVAGIKLEYRKNGMSGLADKVIQASKTSYNQSELKNNIIKLLNL